MQKVMACVDGTASVGSVVDCAAWAARRLGALLEFPLPVAPQGLDRRRDGMSSIGHPARRADDGRLPSPPVADGDGILIARHRDGPYQRLAAALTDEAPRRISLVVLGKPSDAPETGAPAAEPDLEDMVAAMQLPAMVAGGQFKPPRRFAIAFDGTAAGRRVIDAVIRSPLLKRLPCDVLMVGQRSAEVDPALTWAHGTLSAAGFEVQAAGTVGSVSRVLPMLLAVRASDLLVVGAHGSSGCRPFTLGSTTAALLHSSPVPLLVMR